MSEHGFLVPPETQDEIVRLYRRGHSFKRIATEVYWSPTCVRRVILTHGITPRSRATSRKQISTDEVLTRTQLYGMGYSLAQVAEMCGCSVTAVTLTLTRAGVSTRGHSEALRNAYRRGRRSGFARGRSAPQEAA